MEQQYKEGSSKTVQRRHLTKHSSLLETAGARRTRRIAVGGEVPLSVPANEGTPRRGQVPRRDHDEVVVVAAHAVQPRPRPRPLPEFPARVVVVVADPRAPLPGARDVSEEV